MSSKIPGCNILDYSSTVQGQMWSPQMCGRSVKHVPNLWFINCTGRLFSLRIMKISNGLCALGLKSTWPKLPGRQNCMLWKKKVDALCGIEPICQRWRLQTSSYCIRVQCLVGLGGENIFVMTYDTRINKMICQVNFSHIIGNKNPQLYPYLSTEPCFEDKGNLYIRVRVFKANNWI